MSNLAEKKAYEKYPKRLVKGIGNDCAWEDDINSYPREYFAKGYEQAQKDFLEKAKAWLDDNAFEYVKTKTFSIYELYDTYDSDALLADFEKAMAE